MTHATYVHIFHKKMLKIVINWIKLRQNHKFMVKIKPIENIETKMTQRVKSRTTVIIYPFYFVRLWSFLLYNIDYNILVIIVLPLKFCYIIKKKPFYFTFYFITLFCFG